MAQNSKQKYMVHNLILHRSQTLDCTWNYNFQSACLASRFHTWASPTTHVTPTSCQLWRATITFGVAQCLENLWCNNKHEIAICLASPIWGLRSTMPELTNYLPEAFVLATFLQSQVSRDSSIGTTTHNQKWKIQLAFNLQPTEWRVFC